MDRIRKKKFTRSSNDTDGFCWLVKLIITSMPINQNHMNIVLYRFKYRQKEMNEEWNRKASIPLVHERYSEND